MLMDGPTMKPSALSPILCLVALAAIGHCDVIVKSPDQKVVATLAVNSTGDLIFGLKKT